MDKYINLIVFLIVIIGSVPVVKVLLNVFFKKSMLKRIGLIFYLVIVFVAFLGRISAELSSWHLLWMAPLVAVVITLAFYYIDQVNLRPIRLVKEELFKMKEGCFDNSAKVKISRTAQDTEIADMYGAMNEMKQKIASVLSEIQNSAEELKNYGETLKTETKEAVDLAEEQTVTISEIYLAISEVAALVAQNTEKAEKAEKIAKKTNVKIDVSNKNVKKAMDSLRDIARKVGIISDISFRTKILSLNADIEASKAGEHGKGFQVVASEIRKLSEHSRATSDVIEKISADSVNTAERTTRIAEQVVPDIKETADLVKEIYEGYKEQNEQTELLKMSVQTVETSSKKYAEKSIGMWHRTFSLAEASAEIRNKISFFNFKENESTNENLTSDDEEFSIKNALEEIKNSIVEKIMRKSKNEQA